jgi:hypothetical protein
MPYYFIFMKEKMIKKILIFQNVSPPPLNWKKISIPVPVTYSKSVFFFYNYITQLALCIICLPVIVMQICAKQLEQITATATYELLWL